MSKKGQKVLASAAIMSLVMSTVAMAAPTTSPALSGSSRVDTSIAIAKQVYAKWTDSKVAVIANGADAHLVDALTVAPLAEQKHAPILLTLGTSTLEDSIINELKAQGVTTVYVVGGTVTTAVDAQLKAAGVQTVTHLAGATRFETAQAINTELEKGGAPSAYAVVNTNASVADALSIAAEAAKQNIEIVLASDANSVPVDLTGKKVYAIGGSGVLSDALVAKLNATRLGGSTRFATNAAVLGGFDSSLDYTTTYVADGTDAHLVDSLPGSVLAGQTGSPIVLVSDTVAPEVSSVLAGKVDKMTTVTPLGGAVNSAAVAAVVNPNSTTPSGPLAVASVAATAANTITVKFNQTPADTSKVTFTVNRDTTPFTVTPTWNGSVATLQYSSNFPTGDYTVDVKNDSTDLGSQKVSIDQEKVAKIEITTDKFATSTDGKSGFFTYRVLDQYGNDITNTSLASIQWTVPGVSSGNVEDSTGEKGVITATVDAGSNFNFLNLSSISITAVDSSDNIVVTKTLNVSASVGTLSDFKLIDLKNVDNKPLQAGDTSVVWDAEYQAKDLAGNLTDNFTLLKNGLVSQNSNDDADTITLSTSGYVTAQIKNEDGKGVIEVKTTSTDPLTSDIPVTITAITKNGTSSTLNLTLKKKSQVDKIVLYAPTEDIAYGDAKEIPFAAYDQDGNQLTKFDDIVQNSLTSVNGTQYYLNSKYNDVTLSPVFNGTSGFYWLKRGDGTAKLMYQAADSTSTNDTTATLTASTNAGKFSTITINIRKKANASTLDVADDSIHTRLTPGAYVRAKHEYFTAKDQYGRAMNLSRPADIANKVPGSIYVNASIISNPNNALQIAGNSTTAGATIVDSDDHIFFDGNPSVTDGGTATVKFALEQIQDDGTSKEVASHTLDFTVEKMSDIEGIKIDPQMDSDTLYNIHKVASGDNGDPSLQIQHFGNGDYYNTYNVWGVDSNDNTVVLPVSQTLTTGASNAYLAYVGLNDGKNDVATGTGYTGSADYNEIKVGANYDIDPASTTVTVTTFINGDVKSDSATIKMSEDTPIAKTFTAPDQIDVKKYATTALLKDVVTVKDQYGEDMLDASNGEVQVYKNGVLLPNNQSNLPINTLTNSDRITVVANNGQSLTMTVKNGLPGTSTATLDTSKLSAEIATATALSQANYTAASWTAMQAELTNATALVANSNATQAQVDAEVIALTNAVTALQTTTPAGNTVSGTIKSGLLGLNYAEITVPDSSKVTQVTLNGNVLVNGTDYTADSATTIKVVPTTSVTASDKIVLTIGGVDYQAVLN